MAMVEEYPPAFERTEVDGVKVVRDEVLQSGLSTPDRIVPIHGTRLLTLEDGRQVFGCRDCEFVGTRGQVSKHRHSEHRRAPAIGSALPPELASMTVREIVDMAGMQSQWGDLLESERQRADALALENAELKLQLRTEAKAHGALKGKLRRMLGGVDAQA